MKSQLTRQARVIPAGALDPSGPVEKIALFNEDGTPVFLDGNNDAGTITAILEDDDLPLITITSPFGINEDDEPYYDPDGASPSEAALLTLDPNDGLPVLTTLTGGF